MQTVIANAAIQSIITGQAINKSVRVSGSQYVAVIAAQMIFS